MPLIGQRVARVDALDKVTGKAQYPDDLKMESMLHGRVLRSRYPHARILSINTERAKRYPGVVAVLTADDIPGVNKEGHAVMDKPILAKNKVRYMGDAVAVVAAETAEIAEEALDLIDVEYEEMPAVFDPVEAMKPDAPKVHDKGNILKSGRIRQGDVAAGFAAADLIVEETYYIPKIDHAYLQIDASLAKVDENGDMLVWTATQWPHADRHQIALALGLPEEKVRVIQMTTGGAFGAREDIITQSLAALLALKTKRPAKLVFSREETVLVRAKKHSGVLRYKTGATKEGKLTAIEVEIVYDAGAYASSSPVVLLDSVSFAAGPYEVPNIKIDGYVVYTNNTFTGAWRGFGSNQPAFAYEQQMDRLAKGLGLDPVEFRLRNLFRPGSTFATGQKMPESVGIRETLPRAAEVAGWPKKGRPSGPTKRRGVGIACGFKNVGYSFGFSDRATAIIEVYPEKVAVKIGACEVGQGVTTALAQMAATELGLPLEKIEMVLSDTAIAPDAGSSSASRHVFTSGNAVRRAAAEARQQVLQKAAELLEAAVEDLEIQEGQIYVKGSPHRSVPFNTVVTAIQRSAPPETASEPPIRTEHLWIPPLTVPMDKETGSTGDGMGHYSFGYCSQIAEVEVDIETGITEVVKLISVNDVGRIINPTLAEGQVHGGAMMTLGYALIEEYVQEQGRAKTLDLHEYLIPTALDIPAEFVPVLIEIPDPNGPFGAKGLGELATIPTPPAIYSAINDALGIWLNELPAKPERILRALRTQGALVQKAAS
ncbi:MAG: molybdopterin-dependent oxidoreductase [Chloroflexi bacterium]|nr:molybdopterin-dependent oxidoreductase [Chloroflexota bacterium]MCL5075992.1 molybdopterin-dependent oxidoreductase [Chloroflexota bacterium]